MSRVQCIVSEPRAPVLDRSHSLVVAGAVAYDRNRLHGGPPSKEFRFALLSWLVHLEDLTTIIRGQSSGSVADILITADISLLFNSSLPENGKLGKSDHGGLPVRGGTE
eukprot:scaffold117971_cov13-Prasinocladus_malaysianus.AAC.1